MSCSDVSSAASHVLSDGSVSISVDIGGRSLPLLVSRPASPSALAALQTIPPHDPDIQADTVLIRDGLRHVLKTSSSPPLFLVQLLASIHGYSGPHIPTVAAGLRVLLQIPRCDELDWSGILSIATTDDSRADNGNASVPLDVDASSSSSSSSPDRIDRLEQNLAALSLTFSALQQTLARDIHATVQAALATSQPSRVADSASRQPPTPSPPPPAASSASPSRVRHGKAAETPSAATAASSAPMDEGPPTWEYKSAAPALAVLGSVYEHLLRTGAHHLAAELFSVKPAIDYAFLPAKEASDTDADTSNVYVAKNSGKKWRTDHPPPRPCFVCGQMQWRADCPIAQSKQAQTASQSFPCGEPPAQCLPNTECTKCQKMHWWFSCPRAADTLHTPKGARFMDTAPQRPQNHGAARYKQRTEDEWSSLDESSDCHSEYKDSLPQKRLRPATDAKQS